MPVLDGVDATRQILDEQPLVRIVALTSFAEQPKVADMLAAGAVGYLLKDCEPSDLLSAMRSAGAGGVPLDPRVASALLPKRQVTSLADQLSEREREVLLLTSKGLANKQIGRSLGHRGAHRQGAPGQYLSPHRRQRPDLGGACGPATTCPKSTPRSDRSRVRAWWRCRRSRRHSARGCLPAD